jgi:hypothetical protein
MTPTAILGHFSPNGLSSVRRGPKRKKNGAQCELLFRRSHLFIQNDEERIVFDRKRGPTAATIGVQMLQTGSAGGDGG